MLVSGTTETLDLISKWQNPTPFYWNGTQRNKMTKHFGHRLNSQIDILRDSKTKIQQDKRAIVHAGVIYPNPFHSSTHIRHPSKWKRLLKKKVPKTAVKSKLHKNVKNEYRKWVMWSPKRLTAGMSTPTAKRRSACHLNERIVLYSLLEAPQKLGDLLVYE